MRPIATLLRAASVVAVAAAVWWLGGLEPSADYYPLEPGLVWRYEVTSPQGGSGTLTVTNGGTRQIGPHRATEQRMEMEQSSASRFVAEDAGGVVIVAEQRPGQSEPVPVDPPSLVLRRPVAVGDTWDAGSTSTTIAPGAVISTRATVESVTDSVTVPAGTFRDCIRVVSNGRVTAEAQNVEGPVEIIVGTRVWYAPGVGVVQTTRRESTDRADLGTLQLSFKLVSR